MSKIICISREYGSGGHEIAVKVAQRLNIPCIDKEMMEQIIIDSDLPEKMLVAADEKRKSPLRYTSVYEGKYKEFYGMAPNDILFELQKRYIREKTKKGDCVIVGRCAEEILKDMRHLVVNIFITAPVEWRVRRKMEEAGTQDRKRIEREIKKIDKHRLAVMLKSWFMPLLLILVIQMSIWINMAIPFFTGSSLIYLGYLVVSTVQMGATIDYAILLSNHYMENRKKLPAKTAMEKTMGDAIPSVLVSASILAIAGFALALVSSNDMVVSLGILIGRGALIPLILVNVCLPALLIFVDKLIPFTTWKAGFYKEKRMCQEKLHPESMTAKTITQDTQRTAYMDFLGYPGQKRMTI